MASSCGHDRFSDTFCSSSQSLCSLYEFVRNSSAFEIMLDRKMFRIRRKQRFWNVSSLWQMLLWFSSQADLLASPDALDGCKYFPTLESLALTSDSESPSVVILEPRYVNSLTSPTIFPCSMIRASERWCILLCLVFLVLILRSMITAVDDRPLIMACMSVWRWAERQTSSAKSRSLSTSERVHRMPY